MILFLVVFAVFLGLRLFTLARGPLLEDHDSVGYLGTTEVFSTLDWRELSRLDPDSSITYPLVAAAVSLTGWSTEASARIASLLFGCIAFLALIAIGRPVVGVPALLCGLALLAVNPALTELGIAVRSEPTYIGLVYLGLAMVWARDRSFSLWRSAAAGLVFGCAFLTRVEGLIYLGVVPGLQAAVLLARGTGAFPWKRFARWSAVFGLTFALLAAPQIWRVSANMGTLALNGRQAWTLLLNEPGQKGYGERIYGLDFRDDMVNIDYLKANPQGFARLAEPGLRSYAEQYLKRTLANVKALFRHRLIAFFGLSGTILFAVGLVGLIKARRRLDAALVVIVLATALVPPLLHDVDIPHILVLGPFVLLVAGYGIVSLAGLLANRFASPPWAVAALAACVWLLTTISWAPALMRVLTPSDVRREYSMAELEAPVRIINTIAETELKRRPSVVSRKFYIGHYAQATSVSIPFADYESLVTYCHLNDVDFVYLIHHLHRDWPFMGRFRQTDGAPDFQLLFRGRDGYAGQPVELYRFRNSR